MNLAGIEAVQNANRFLVSVVLVKWELSLLDTMRRHADITVRSSALQPDKEHLTVAHSQLDYMTFDVFSKYGPSSVSYTQGYFV